jgi:hypothetical protein
MAKKSFIKFEGFDKFGLFKPPFLSMLEASLPVEGFEP